MYKEYHFSTSTTNNTDEPVFSLGADSCYVDRYKIISAYIPMSFDPINSANNMISWREGDQIYNATVAAGRYDIEDFPGALQTAMDDSSSPSTFRVTFDLLTRKISIQGSTPFQILSGMNGTSLWRVLGISRTISQPVGTNITLGVTDLTSNAPLILSSSTLSSRHSVMVGQNAINCLAVIPADGNPGQFVHYVNPSSGWLECQQDLTFIDFRLIDSTSGRAVSLNGNGYFVSLGVLTDSDDPEV